MVTQDAALRKLMDIERDLNNDDAVTTVMRDTSLGLFSILSTGRELPVDSEIIFSLKQIVDRLEQLRSG
jgi:hypothetical protein